AYRKHQAVAKAVAKAVVVAVQRAAVGALALDDESAFEQHLAIGIRGTEALDQFVPGVWREADHETLDRLAREAAFFCVLPGACISRKHAREKLRRLEIQVVQRLGAARVVRLARRLTRHLQAQPSGQLLDGLRKRQLVVLHEKPERRAVRPAAKAVIELLLRAHPERGGFLVVKRAAGAVLAACFLELHSRADELDDVRARGQLVDETLGNSASHGGPILRRSAWWPRGHLAAAGA